tara:strand:- start:997 stop:1197 length:201 start_codon:yes stop_codon:yes gene_type:complete
MAKVKKVKPMKPFKGLRLKFYADAVTDNGSIVSGIADQFGRLMEQFVDEENRWDVKPTGLAIYVNH